MINKRSFIFLLWATISSIVVIWYFGFGGKTWISNQFLAGQTSGFIDAIILIASLMIVYKIGCLFIGMRVQKSKGTPGETTMMQNVFKFLIGSVIFVVLLTSWFSLGALGSFIIAFGGMFLGWSLQSPISGMAAWLLISIVRPFRIGDRVQLPTYGLVGDIISITPLYTSLNQVGGSVGSEEPANRTILIPNAMLFSSLVINYTPKDQDLLIKQSQEKKTNILNSQTAYMLDEFVLRISFDSDWDEAEKILLNAANEVTADIIAKTGQKPYIRADTGDWYGIFMRLRFSTNAVERPKIIYEISKKVYKAIQGNPKVDLAIPYIYSYKRAMPVNAMYDLQHIPPSQEPPYIFENFNQNGRTSNFNMKSNPSLNGDRPPHV